MNHVYARCAISGGIAVIASVVLAAVRAAAEEQIAGGVCGRAGPCNANQRSCRCDHGHKSSNRHASLSQLMIMCAKEHAKGVKVSERTHPIQ